MTEWQKRKLTHQRKLDRLTKFHYENKMHFEIMRCAVEKNYQLSLEKDREYENYMIKELRKFYRKLQSELKKAEYLEKSCYTTLKNIKKKSLISLKIFGEKIYFFFFRITDSFLNT